MEHHGQQGPQHHRAHQHPEAHQARGPPSPKNIGGFRFTLRGRSFLSLLAWCLCSYPVVIESHRDIVRFATAARHRILNACQTPHQVPQFASTERMHRLILVYLVSRRHRKKSRPGRWDRVHRRPEGSTASLKRSAKRLFVWPVMT